MKQRLIRTFFILTCIYVLLLVSGAVFSLFLPGFRDLSTVHAASCYWTNAMLVFVKCGGQVFAGNVLEVFYNFWLYLIYFPMFAIGGVLALGKASSMSNLFTFFYIILSLIAYAPLAFFAWQLGYRFLRRINTKG